MSDFLFLCPGKLYLNTYNLDHNLTMEKEEEAICCPPFDPAPWDGQTIVWKDKKFIREKVCTFLFMPLNFGSVMRKAFAKAQAAGVSFVDNLGLSDHTSRWNMDIYIAVDKEVPGSFNVTLSGNFFCKVYEGPFSDTGKWGKDYDEAVRAKGLAYEKMYMWYTTCPKCAKKYGKNYTVILGRLT